MFILCIFLPPLAAGILGGFTSFFVNLILTCIGWLPGIVHAYMLMKKSEVEEKNKELIKQLNNPNKEPEEKQSGILNFIIVVILLLIVFFLLENTIKN